MGRLTCAGLEMARGGFRLEVESLVVEPGEKVALLGENGCGKTTLLQVLGGLLPAKGSVEYGGLAWAGSAAKGAASAESRAASLAYLPQEAGVLFNLSVAELIELALDRGLLLNGDERRKALAATEMEDFLERAYPSLSGGERRRAMLARLFCRRASLVLLDEPTAPLDMRHSDLFMRYAASVPATVLAAMHDLNLALRHFERFLLMKNGRIIFDKRKEELETAELEEIYGLRLDRCGDHFFPA